LYEHEGSRYGQVGSVTCDCGEELSLTDDDNIIDYISIHLRKLKVVLDFKDLFKMNKADFENLKINHKYDIYEKYLNQTIELTELIDDIEKLKGETISPSETVFPATIPMKKWLKLMTD
jgi:hypothetical protein